MASSDRVTPAFVRLASHPLRWRLLAELAQSDYRVRELVTLAGEPQNLVSYHLRLLRDGGLVTARRSSFDGRDSYYHLDLDRCAEALTDAGAALHPALESAPQPVLHPVVRPAPGRESAPYKGQLDLRRSPRIGVLFVCTGNSARSPMAEALLRHRTGGRVEVASAGSRPKSQLHAKAVRVLHDEFGVDVTGRCPRHWDSLSGRRFDHVISLCDKAREVCPDFPGRPRRAHWSIPDPAAADDGVGEGDGDGDRAGYHAFQRTAAEIDTRITHLLPVLTATRS